jgi:hypothetical protein
MIRVTIFFVSIIIASFCYSQNNVTQGVDGGYFLEEYGEELIDGGRVYLKYDINIDNNETSASIKLTTWHAPITCEGDYTIRKQEGVLLLSFIGDQKSCAYTSPQYEIKKENNKLYMRGKAMAYNQGRWIKLSSKK